MLAWPLALNKPPFRVSSDPILVSKQNAEMQAGKWAMLLDGQEGQRW